ncbi:Lipid-A-disaccharide synthase [Granulosicoccus antarcticus IMCC3135]|uniref:Lipid-A-disaccharide synthase n=2 Tax=Granulosicoccus TaxID=437504 RepID=A0A2Z2NXG5_9GAMM|nr:Lipid-A-disaccharide synthase [Granulosicoccus antarcticus IMCC3135]
MTASKTLSVMVSAGEASGDAHAAHAIEALRDQAVQATCFGMGADALQKVGVELIVDCRDLAVIGIVDVLINYPRFMKRLALLRETMRQRMPDILVIVDYPDFNLKLAQTAKSLGIPVLFYISPKVWAWRAGRVERISKLVSHMAVLFPFEVEIYQQAGVPVTYVGNPVVADAVSAFTIQEARQHFNLQTDKPVVTLLPGSRTGEIMRNLPAMLATASIIARQVPDCQFLLPVAPTLSASFINETIGQSDIASLSVVTGDSRHAMRAADVALVASGTATLETAMVGTPLVVMYIINQINYAIMKRLIKIPDISLVNIVAGKRIVPEYVQHEATPEAMASDVLSLMHDDQRRQQMHTEFSRLKELMGDEGASTRVAELILQLTRPERVAVPV